MARTKQTARKSTNMGKKAKTKVLAASAGAAEKKPAVFAITSGLSGPAKIEDEPLEDGAQQVGFMSFHCTANYQHIYWYPTS